MRIAIISDMHSSTGHLMEEAKLLIEWCEYYFLHWLVRKFEKDMKEANKNNKHVRETLAKMRGDIKNPTRYDLIICNGDVSQTGDEDELRGAYRLIREYFPDTPIVFVLGNHDTKSCIWITDQWFENFSQEQLDLFRLIFEGQEPYGLRPLTSEIDLIWLMSDPFIFDWHTHQRDLSVKTCNLLHDLQEEQLVFLVNALQQAKAETKKIVLAIHDPAILLSKDLRNALRDYQGQILVTLTGHIHARWLMRLICVRHPILWPQLLWHMRTYKARLISSVWGITLPHFLWMAGGGWSVLELDEREKRLISYYVNSDSLAGERLGEIREK